MLFPIPEPHLWADPGDTSYSRWQRRLARWLKIPFVPARETWIQGYQAYEERLAAERDEYDHWLRQVEAYEMAMAEYDEQGDHMAEMLPEYLHHLKLSHWRKVQEKKSERYYDHVDYCEVDRWYFDENAYYFLIVTWPLPYGVSIAQFLEPDVANTLSSNFGSKTSVEHNPNNHERPGLWVIVEHKAGRGLVPGFIAYSDMIKSIPKTAPPLVFPIGVGANSKGRFYDMDEIYTVLVAGQKGSGKSNQINSIICTWLQRAKPDELRLFLTDLKGGLEFYAYNGIPHLGGDVELKMRLSKDGESEMVRLGQEVLEEPYQVAPVLRYMEQEMSRRQKLMKGRARKISTYNKKHKKKPLSRWVLVVDELATLADSEHKKECYTPLAELVRKGRAVGIYIMLATQVPDKTVLTRQIAGNLDFRMVGYLPDGPSSALTLGDGSWDATRLPPDVKGRMVCRWNKKQVVQTPYISELVIDRVIKAVKLGQQSDAQATEESAIAQEIFTYALEFLGGQCAYREIFAHFRNRIPERKIRNVLKAFELDIESLTPVIPLEDDEYYLLPSLPDGNEGQTGRRLVDVVDFHEQKWLDRLRQAASGNNPTNGVGQPNSKIEPAAEPEWLAQL